MIQRLRIVSKDSDAVRMPFWIERSLGEVDFPTENGVRHRRAERRKCYEKPILSGMPYDFVCRDLSQHRMNSPTLESEFPFFPLRPACGAGRLVVCMGTLSLPTIRGWQVVLLLVAAMLFSPGRATAGCGDYVNVLNPTAESLRDPIANHDNHGRPAKPCHGPSCSNQPDRPIPSPAPTAPTTVQVKELVPISRPVDCDLASNTFTDISNRSSRPIHRPLSVFHPPRLSNIS